MKGLGHSMRTLRACAFIIFALILFSCGGHNKARVGGAGDSGTNNSGAAVPAVISAHAQTLGDALAQLDALPVPAGVKPEVFMQLKDALREALRAKATSKVTSTPPTGDANRVNDLAIADNGDGTYSLTWHYRNLGDYNQDGTVGVSDITPLAIHYNETANPSNEWVDGSGNGKIDISDVTPIAMNFAIQVDHYAIEASDTIDSGFTPLAMCQLPTADNLSRLSIPYSLGATPAYTFWRVAPVDASGAQGDYSNVAQVGQQSLTLSIDTPLDAATFTVGNSTTFTASVTDVVAISKVEFFIKGSLYYTDTAAPWEAPVYTFVSGDLGSVVFAARATNADNATASEIHTVTVNPASGTPPAAPTNLEATTASYSQINLLWQDNSSDEDGFRIERKEGATGTWSEIGLTAADAKFYPDTGLLPSTAYYYRVRAANASGYSVFSNEDSDTTYSAPPYTVSGTVTKSTGGGLPGVTLTLGGYFAVTDSSGNYTITGVQDGDYTLTPSLTGWTFNPTSQSVTVSGGNVNGKNFIANLITYLVSGTVTKNIGGGLPGATLTLTPGDYSASTNSSGNYIISGVPNGNYTLTPSLRGWSFDPTNLSIAVSGSNVMGNHFTADACAFVHTWGGSVNDYAQSLGVDNSGNIYAAGYTESFGAGDWDAFLLKYSFSGTLLWQKTWGGIGNDRTFGLALDGSGYVYVAGLTSGLGASGWDTFLLKYSSGGTLLWEKTWGGSNFEEISALAVDSGGNAYLAGRTQSFSTGNYDTLLLKYSSSGTLLWQKTWGGSNTDIAHTLGMDVSGNVYVTGDTKSFGGGDWDTFLLKYSPSGNLLWQNTWAGFSDYDDSASALGIDSSGNVFVAGDTGSWSASGLWDALLLKYSFDGSLLWQKTWGGSDKETAFALAVGCGGLLYLVGRSPSAYGSWGTPVGSISSPNGNNSDVNASASNVSGTETTPNGTETMPDGIEDEGGGMDDAFVMKIDPSDY